mmetsp:Transcript_39121/g.76912  ORF Transcript_39121/g.76912 Transcript_39121/m.76912 type:complete len:321 (-) Transcript_39121:507-1469(-)
MRPEAALVRPVRANWLCQSIWIPLTNCSLFLFALAYAVLISPLCLLSYLFGLRSLQKRLLLNLHVGPWSKRFTSLWMCCCHRRRGCLYVRPDTQEVVECSPDLVPRAEAGCVRLVLISDTHEKHNSMPWIPPGDILCHVGDILLRNSAVFSNCNQASARALTELHSFNTFLGTLLHKHKIVVGGNHDGVLQALGSPEQVQKILSNAIYLENTTTTLEGISFFGTPYSKGSSPNSAFQDRQPAAVQAIQRACPTSVDVILSHGPNKGVFSGKQCRLFVYGHVHEQWGAKCEASGTVVACACTCNGLYLPVHLPIVVDIKSH